MIKMGLLILFSIEERSNNNTKFQESIITSQKGKVKSYIKVAQSEANIFSALQ